MLPFPQERCVLIMSTLAPTSIRISRNNNLTPSHTDSPRIDLEIPEVMANPPPQDIKSLLESINSLSTNASLRPVVRESGSLNEPRHGLTNTLSALETTSIDTFVGRIQTHSLSSRNKLSSTITNRQLGMLSHTAAEIRNSIYDIVAENATYALNETEAMSLLTSGQSNPPQLINASPQIEHEFAARLKKSAWPTILIGQDFEIRKGAATRVLDLIDEHCLLNKRLTKLTIVAQMGGVRWIALLINLLSPETISVPNNNHSDLSKLRIILYLKGWENIYYLRRLQNLLSSKVGIIWMAVHGAFALQTPRATRFLALQELELEVRYESPWGSEEYTFCYTKAQGQSPHCDTIFIPRSTRYRESREEVWNGLLTYASILRVYLNMMGLKWCVICLGLALSWDGAISLESCFWRTLRIGLAETIVVLKWEWPAIILWRFKTSTYGNTASWEWCVWSGLLTLLVGYMHISVPWKVLHVG